MERIKLLALSGSLRKASYNTAALKALGKLAPESVTLTVYDGLGKLPLFNPDLEPKTVPSFESLRSALAESDGLIIASPEYAHGVSGVLKNALDWLVAGEEFVYMPTALINTSPRAFHAQAMLREIINTMSGIIVEDACISIPLLGSNLDADGIINRPEIAYSLKVSLEALCSEIVDLKLNERCCAL